MAEQPLYHPSLPRNVPSYPPHVYADAASTKQQTFPHPHNSSTTPPTLAQHHTLSTGEDVEALEYRSLRIEKAVTTLSAGLLSILVISLSYISIFGTADIFHTTIAPLASASILIVASIISTLYLIARPGVVSKLAVLPIVFAIVGGAMIVLLNTASKALSEGGFVNIELIAVMLSAGVFGGLGLGATIGFVLFAGMEDWRFRI